MNRKAYIIVLLFLSWGIGNIHRIWNNTDPVYTNPFPFDRDYPVTWHWYIHTILKDVSVLSVLLALWLYVTGNFRRDKGISTIFGAIFVIQLTDLPHYILAARHSEVVLAIQGAILLYAALKITFNAKSNG